MDKIMNSLITAVRLDSAIEEVQLRKNKTQLDSSDTIDVIYWIVEDIIGKEVEILMENNTTWEEVIIPVTEVYKELFKEKLHG